MDFPLYQQALDAVAIANAARGIHEHPGGPLGDREEFPIVDSEATILVTPGEPLAEVLILGNPTGVSVSAIPDGAGGYIFVPPDADSAGELGNVIGFPIAPDDVINAGVMMNESDETSTGSEENLPWGTWQDYPKVTVDGREYAQVGDRLYTRHAIDRMQPSALGTPAGGSGPGRAFPPNLVEEVIRNGSTRIEIVNGVERTIHSLGTAEVVTEQGGRIVVTVNPFRGG